MWRRVFTGFVLLSAIIVAGCGKDDTIVEEQTLRIGTLYTPDTLPLFVAMEKGFYESENIKVELIPFLSAMERDSAFTARQLDGMTSDLVGSSVLRARGVDLRIVLLTVGDQAGTGRMAILASPYSDIYTLNDLKGRPVAMSSNSVVEYVADELLRSQGFDKDDIRKSIVSKIPIRLNMLVEGQVPAAILPDPLARYAEMKGARLLVDDTKENLSQAVLSFWSTSLSTKQEAMQRFIRALVRASEEINTNPTEYQQLLARVTRTPSGVEGFHVVNYPIKKVPTELQVARVQHWLTDKELLGEVPLYSDIVSDEFVR